MRVWSCREFKQALTVDPHHSGLALGSERCVTDTCLCSFTNVKPSWQRKTTDRLTSMNVEETVFTGKSESADEDI